MLFIVTSNLLRFLFFIKIRSGRKSRDTDAKKKIIDQSLLTGNSHTIALALRKIFFVRIYLFFVLFFFASIFSKAQTADTSKLYLQFPDIPPFSIMKAPDSTAFTKADLKKRKPTLIILFSPDCDHCKHEIKALKADIALLKGVQIVMVSFLNYDLINKFYKEYNLDSFPNITMGRDGKYFLGTFYKLHTYPSMFLYNKKGKFVKDFEGSIAIKKIAESF